MSTVAVDRTRIINRALNPRLTDLPAWVRTIRPHQVKAVREVLEGFQTADLVFLDAPTGTGKTLIAETVRRLMGVRGLYVCTTKSLQHQFVRDFDASLVMGRSNYPTVLLADDFPDVSCEDCTIQSGSCQLCPERDDCPYLIAKTAAATSDVAVLNTAYLFNEARAERSMFRGRPLMVIDEADTAENELMRFVSVEVSESRMRRWGWQPPDKSTVAESWAEWLVDHQRELGRIQADHRTHGDHQSLAWQREARFLRKLKAQIGDIVDGFDSGIWVYTGRDGHGVSFKPSRVHTLGETLWTITDGKWLLMSATPISVEERLDSLGWEGAYRVVKVDSTFPVENRRVRFVPAGSMSAKHRDAATGNVADAIETICGRHPRDRVLIHTVSYQTTGVLRSLLRHRLAPRPVLSYATAKDRQATLERYEKTEAAILLAPSMARGIDLPGDACRVQIIVKIPYPYLGDRQVSARLHSSGGRTWYLCETIRTLVQMTGRAIRSADDWAETWILDSDFENLWARGRGLFPAWWIQAVVWRPEDFDADV